MKKIPNMPFKKRMEWLRAKYGERACWPWQSRQRTLSHYATTSKTVNGKTKTVLAHRRAYEEFVGPIPGKYEVDHTCRTRDCVNPSHLEAVTKAENNRRAAPYRLSDRCKAGHLRTAENTYTTPAGVRSCITCRRISRAEKRGRAKILRPSETGACKRGHPYPESMMVLHGDKVCRPCYLLRKREQEKRRRQRRTIT